MSKQRGYQHNFAEQHAEMYSDQSRALKAETMRLILRDALDDRLASANCLNVGCSTGLIDRDLAPHVGRLVGIDIDDAAVAFAEQSNTAPNAQFRVGDAMNLEFSDDTFDIVICSQVYEHVPDPARLMQEIRRVLKVGGVCYFAATNRLNPIEQHYKLPFLSIIPVWMAHWYLRALGRGEFYYERHFTYWSLRRLVAEFALEDMTPAIVQHPDRYGTQYLFGDGAKLRIARAVQKFAYWLFPGYIWLLWKREPTQVDQIR